MSVSPIEAGQGAVWRSKQTTLGTKTASNAATMQRLRLVGDGGFKAAKVVGSEEYVDGLSFGSPAQFIDQIGGEVGSITYQAQPETAGYAFAQIIGVDVVTGSSPDYTHTIASGNTNGALQTYYQEAGVSTPVKQVFYDALINKLTWSAGQDNKTAHIQEDVMSLNAAEWYTTSPTAADSGSDPFNWNEVTAEVKINGTALEEADGDTLDIDRKLDVHRGDSAAPACFIYGKGEISRSISAVATNNTIPLIKEAVYGTATPTAGDGVDTAPSYVEIASKYTRSAERSLEIINPKVSINPGDFEVFPKAEGGKIPVTFSGMCLKDGSDAALTVVAKTADSAAYV